MRCCVNLLTDQGYTALHCAAAGGEAECYHCLLQHHADPSITIAHTERMPLTWLEDMAILKSSAKPVSKYPCWHFLWNKDLWKPILLSFALKICTIQHVGCHVSVKLDISLVFMCMVRLACSTTVMYVEWYLSLHVQWTVWDTASTVDKTLQLESDHHQYGSR